MDGSGWATIMLTWFYTLWWFTIADAAKTLIQWVRAFINGRHSIYKSLEWRFIFLHAV